MSSPLNNAAAGIVQKVGTVDTVGTGGTNWPATPAAVQAANRVAIALLELELLGYEFALAGPPGAERLRYRCNREPKPDPAAVRPWLRVLQAGRLQALAFLRTRRQSAGRPFDLAPYLDRAADKAFENGLRLLDAGQDEAAAYEFGRCVRLREAVKR